MIQQDTRKQLKRILESNLEEGQKVELLADLVEQTVKYLEGYQKIQNEFAEQRKQIFEKRG